MRTTYFTCILICFISLLTTTAQNKSTAYDSLSKINMISHPHTAPISNEVLLQYKKELNQDAEKHRAFMEKYYENFNKLFRIIAIAIGVGLTFFGFASFIQIKQAVKNVFESEYERQIQNKLKSYEDRVNTITERFEAIDKKVEEKFDKVDAALNYLEEAIKRQSRLNALQEASIIRQRKKLSSQYKITKSVNILKYLDAEGKRVQLERTQTLIGISKSNPVQTLIEFAGTSSEGENAQIKVVEKDENTEIIEESKKALQLTTYLKDYLKLGETLKRKAKIEFINSFCENKESWTLSQRCVIEQETFMLKLPKIEKFENIEISIKEVIGNQEETIALESTIIDEDDYKIYSFALDRANEPSKIEIEWVFLGQPRLPFLRLK